MGDNMEARAREIFDGVGMMRHLGVDLVRVDAQSAVLAFTVDERHANYLGGLHGGAVAAVIDTAVFFPGDMLPSGRKLTTEGLDIHYFRPAGMGDRITVRATLLRTGRRVCTVEAKAENQSGKPIAHAVVTLLDMAT